MFECLGCGKPFIGTRVGGIPETITSDTYGILSEPGKERELGTNILLALNRKWDYAAILSLRSAVHLEGDFKRDHFGLHIV